MRVGRYITIAIKFAFGSQYLGFALSNKLMCYIKQTISVKILLTCVTNSSRHRKRFVQDYIHSLFVSKALTRSYLARSDFDTNYP